MAESGNKANSLFEKIDEFAEKPEASSENVEKNVKNLIALARDSAAKHEELGTEIQVSNGKAENYVQKLESNQSEITKTMLNQMLTINRLVDMEWKFGVTASSSESISVGSTFLQLKLVIDKGSGNLENVYMELTLPQFYSFLHEMERAKLCMEQIS